MGEENQVIENPIEVEARAMGWKSLEEYGGDPEKHIPADRFVQRAKEKAPIAIENLDRLIKKDVERERELNEVKETLRATREYQEHMSKTMYERAVRELKQEQAKAVEDGDVARFEQLDQQREKLKDDYSPKPIQTVPVIPNEVNEFKERNPWFGTDYRMSEAAKFYENQLLSLPLAERFKEVEKRVKADFPEKFQTTQAKLPSVEGTRQPGSKPAGKTWHDIPEADRIKAESWIKKGAVSREQYIKDYFGE